MTRGNDLTVAAWLFVNVALVVVAFWTAKWARREKALRLEEKALSEEFYAYAALDPRVTPGESQRVLAKRMCASVVQWSAFRKVAMLVRDAENRLRVMGSAGVDDLMLLEVNEWGERSARERQKDVPRLERRRSYSARLGSGGDSEVIVVPLWSETGMMLGAILVWPVGMVCERVLAPLEALGVKLGRAFDLAGMQDRLLRAEKMAGLGYLAKGVAHELNNPLTAVLGFAELIAETSTEPRVREDAVAIVGQAARMKETVDSLLQFWRPAMLSKVRVDVAEMLRGVVGHAESELMRRGVQLVLIAEASEGCCVRGDEHRLMEVFEHLLNNAAQAVTEYGGEGRSIRLTLTCDEERVRVVVSDSGAGFADAARVFDPFYTTRQPGDGQGMGLAVSYGIVREHGGEISALNLHPHGAAVVVELPVASIVREVLQSVAA